ncbi:TIGR02679 family protein [Streptomyces sp. NPDC014646]|uniref:TIGR02679 family protein n=1 Tax=Streptomyces sp. NPDC014646 TaxID=3364877 RepID=UPI0036F81287
MELTHGPEPGTEAVDSPRLARLLGTPDLSWLVERARRRLVAGQPLTGSVSLADPTPAQRAAAERLLARAPGGGKSLTVRLEAVDAVLRRSGASPNGLAAAVAALTGPVTSLVQARQEEEDAWKRAHTPLDELVATVPALAEWAVRIRADGLARRLGRTPDVTFGLLSGVCTALRALPAVPVVSLSAFAARVLGWAHALDDGTPLATITLSGARALSGFHEGQGAEWRRDAWASVGLLRDELSSTVLTLNLRGTPALDRLAEEGEPCVLTLRQLTRKPPAVAAPMVRICENPTVLAAAADVLGPACPPLVCLQGQPSAAALTLLRGLHANGATLYYHGDFDWGGLRIADVLRRRVPWRPWRFTAADYRAAVLRCASPPLSPLAGTPTETPWEPALAAAVGELGVRVEEERELELLLSDLA